jgi:hypothetical protein
VPIAGETSAEVSELHRVYHRQRGAYGRWNLDYVGTQGPRGGLGRTPAGAVEDPKLAAEADGSNKYDQGILARQRAQTAGIKTAGRRKALKRMTQGGGGA